MKEAHQNDITKINESISNQKDKNKKAAQDFEELKALKQGENQALVEENSKMSAQLDELHEELSKVKAENAQFSNANEEHKRHEEGFQQMVDSYKKKEKEIKDKIQKMEEAENAKYDLDRF